MATILENSTTLCSACGSTLFVQEHHTSHDPEVTENLCVFCHAGEHISKRSLILASAVRSRTLSRWNIPLHILADRARVSPAAIVLRAQRHNIRGGILSPEQESILSEPSRYKKRETKAVKLVTKVKELENRFLYIVDSYKSVPRRYSSHNKTTTEMNIEKARGMLRGERCSSLVFCRQCGHIWKRRTWHPIACPRCYSSCWDKKEVTVGTED